MSEVTINNCDTYVTGIGANTVSADSSSTTCTTAANKYDGTYGKLARTTGNVTGVYDMSGGSWEYVMGNISSVTTGYTFYPSSTALLQGMLFYAQQKKFHHCISNYSYQTYSNHQ